MTTTNTSSYCNSIIINGYNSNNPITIVYNGGAANISTTISSATVITQQIAIFNFGTNYAISNVSAFYA